MKIETTPQIIAIETDYYIFNKAAGVSFHSENGAGFVVQAEALVGESLFAVHRLDKVTSGLIILARNKAAAAEFTELFASRRINKFYVALTDQKPKKKQGWVKGDMSKSRRGGFKLLKSHHNPAITRFYSVSLRANLRAFLLKPYSGKTHQLRVAMKSIAAPILGDLQYSGSAHDRTYLHAYALSFLWRGTLKHYRVTDTQGKQFSELFQHDSFQHWSAPWQLDW
ncbi:TIGR01621 family pseudouridine synthase [Pseudoalteromonas mariniglutinosa]|uniref:TIGR01621 family pseudouridine synthase n=1 Tax=Pseudoalteromonas mariniglutinosa TaxID=206042 RepID=UPI00385049E1